MIALLIMVGLRVVHLRSDPYVRIDWDTGILTDEGFYIHNARNVVLFGRARTDDFNNMLLAPLWHGVQVATFTEFGVGSVQARLISVVAGLLSVFVLFAALRRWYGLAVSATASLLFGLDHVSTLFQRLALLDVPSGLLAVCAFGCFVRSLNRPRRLIWLASCGALIALTVTNRTLCIYLLPVPFLALAAGRSDWKAHLAAAAGIVTVLALYTVLWYLPHRSELAHMNHYYRTVQVQPRSWQRLRGNIKLAFLGETYGPFSYLFRHTPVVFGAALLMLGGLAAMGRRDRNQSEAASSGTGVFDGPTVYLAAWLLLGWAELAVSNYAPDRYLITTHPALYALAAVALWRLPIIAGTLGAGGWRARLARATVAWFLAYHAIEAVLHRGGVLPPDATYAILYTGPTLIALAAGAWGRVRSNPSSTAHHLILASALGLWALANVWWYADWLENLEYTQYRFNRWLVGNLPPDSVLLGDVAPGVTMDTHFMAVDVQEGLCNDRNPVERWAAHPTYILLLDWVWKEPYWIKRYPALVAPKRRMRHVRILRWWIGMYPAGMAAGSSGRGAGAHPPMALPPHTRRHRDWTPRE
ncbi:MAG: ArnT family glycosyltransferase [Chthonomonadales bacterium]